MIFVDNQIVECCIVSVYMCWMDVYVLFVEKYIKMFINIYLYSKRE